jgi:hypothetical protein
LLNLNNTTDLFLRVSYQLSSFKQETIYKMMYKTPTYAEHQHYNRPFSSGQLSAFIIQTGNWPVAIPQ